MPGWMVKLIAMIRNRPSSMSWLEMNPVFIRQANKDDLPDLEWNGEYKHFRRLYADTYLMATQGQAILWIAELKSSGLIGQCFVSLKGNRPDLADGVTGAYTHG